MRTLSAAPVRSEINVTPLVDVVLVLLIIFMVVTPMLQNGPAVRLPVTQDPPRKPEQKDQLLLAIRDDRTVWIDRDRVEPAGLGARLAEARERGPGRAVVIKADARLSYGDVKRAMLEVKAAGFASVGLIVDKRQGS